MIHECECRKGHFCQVQVQVSSRFVDCLMLSHTYVASPGRPRNTPAEADSVSLLVDVCPTVPRGSSQTRDISGSYTFFKFNCTNKVNYGEPCDAPTVKSKKWNYCTLGSIQEAFRFLFHNTYVMLGDKVFRQKIGIPMGTNCAVHVANYFLFSYELDFVERLIRFDKIELLKSFMWTRRYIDDVLNINCPEFAKFHTLENIRINDEFAGIYPKALKLNLEIILGHEVHYLDLKIFYNRRSQTFETDIYSKTTDPKFAKLAFCRYPHITSKLSMSCKYNIITSQITRFARLCSTSAYFIKNTCKLITTLQRERGYNLERLLQFTNKTLRRFIPIWEFSTVSAAIDTIKCAINRPIIYASRYRKRKANFASITLPPTKKRRVTFTIDTKTHDGRKAT